MTGREEDPFFGSGSAHLQREKARSRKMRDSPWWKRKRSDGKCYYCHRLFKPSELTMDHLIPLARGGLSTKENIVPCCKECNSRKKYLLPDEFADLVRREREERELPEAIQTEGSEEPADNEATDQ